MIFLAVKQSFHFSLVSIYFREYCRTGRAVWWSNLWSRTSILWFEYFRGQLGKREPRLSFESASVSCQRAVCTCRYLNVSGLPLSAVKARDRWHVKPCNVALTFMLSFCSYPSGFMVYLLKGIFSLKSTIALMFPVDLGISWLMSGYWVPLGVWNPHLYRTKN